MMSKIRWRRGWPALAVAGLILAFAPGVGYAATVPRTTDIPVGQALDAVSCVPASGTAWCWAVGGGGTIKVSHDDGRRWSWQHSGTFADLRGVTFVSAWLGFVVGAQGTILETADGGATWSAVGTNPSTTLTFNAVACSQDRKVCWAVGSGVAASGSGVAAFLSPPTSPWTLEPITGAGGTCAGTSNACANAVALTSDRQAFAGGGGGTIFRWLGGLAWPVQLNVGAGYFGAISCLPELAPSQGQCIAVGTDQALTGGWIYYTFNSGSTWTPAAASQPLNGASIAPYNGNDAVAVGDGGSILRTFNGGVSWIAVSAPTVQTLYGVSCPAGPGLDCVAVGAYGTVVRTAP